MIIRERARSALLRSAVGTAMLLCVGQAQLAVADVSGAEPGVWTAKKVELLYKGITSRYTCDGLRDRLRKVVLELGAREVRVRVWGCIKAHAPERSPGVSIWMSVLQPARGGTKQPVPAHWENVDLLARRDVVDASADCELIQQIKREILPLFASRNVVYAATCQGRGLLVGATGLSADVLVPDAGTRTDSPAQ